MSSVQLFPRRLAWLFSSGLLLPALVLAAPQADRQQTHPQHEHSQPHEHKAQHEDQPDLAAAELAHEQHGAHVHGAGQLMLASEGDELTLMLQLTAADLLGFEHAPQSAAEQQSWQQMAQQLKEAAWLSLPAAAGCQPADSGLTDPWSAGSPAQHADLELTLSWHCTSVEALQQLELQSLFHLASGLQQLSVQWVHQQVQGAALLTPAAAVLSLQNH